MQSKPKRFLSILLTLAMVLTMLPMATLPVAAETPAAYPELYPTTVEVNSGEELRAALQRTDNILIKLTENIEYAFGEAERDERGKWVLIDFEALEVETNKAIDLNGKTLAYVNTSGYKMKDYTYMFNISKGRSLHMLDSVGGGLVRTDGYMSENSESRFNDANIFKVEGGTLVIDGGEYWAGRAKKTWVAHVLYVDGKMANVPFHGYAYRLISGRVIVNDRGKVVINGGSFHAVGDGGRWGSSTKGVVLRTYKGESVVNGGYMRGDAGGRCFSNEEATLIVNGGTFETTSRKVVTDYGYQDLEENVSNRVGPINLPKECVNPRFSGYRYGARNYLPSDMQEDDFIKGNNALTIYPGKPNMSLSPEVEDGFYLLAKDAPYTITASAERYYTDIGLGRESILEYTVGENYQIIDWDAEFSPDTDAVSYRNYSYQAIERLPWQKQTDPDLLVTTIPFAVKVTEQDLRPIPWIEIVGASDNHFPLGAEDIQLRAAVGNQPQEDMTKYEWYLWDKNELKDTLVETHTDTEYFTVQTNVAGEFIYKCVVTNNNGAVGHSRSCIITVAEQMAPILLPDQVFLNYNVKTDELLLPRNIGGPADSWTYEGSIPTGLQFYTADGFTGKPTESGRFPLTMTATNTYGSDSAMFTIVVSEPVNITTGSVPAGIAGNSYTTTLATDGGGDIVWSLAAGKLPEGLTLGARSGQITGTPTEGGEFKFTARVQVSGYAPVTKEFTLTIHEKPAYPSTVEKTVTRGRLTTIASPLTAGAGESGISYWLIGFPTGVSVVAAGQLGAGNLIVGENTQEGVHEFTLHAKNDYGEASTNVIITVSNAPSFNKSYIEPEMGEKGVYFDTGSLEEYANYTLNKCEWVISGLTPLPAGLSFSTTTGAISGTPTQDTGLNDKGYPAIETVSFILKDTVTGLESTFPLYVWLRIADTNGRQAPSILKLSHSDYSTGVNEWVKVETDGVPLGSVTLESGALPPGLNLYDDGSFGTTILGKPYVKGSYTFTLKSDNKIGSPITKTFTVTVGDPVKASVPTVTPAPGIYKKGTPLNLTFTSPNGDGFVKYSINGDPEKLYATTPVEITDDAVITAYVDTFGNSKLNSDVVTFRYTFINDPNVVPPVTTITNTALADGLINTPYGATDLTATTTGTDPIKWTATGLPAGMTLSVYGKLTGTPTEAGIFNVNLLATAGTSDSKTLDLRVLQTPADTPTITSQPASATYKLNAVAAPLTVAATVSDGGSISYQWFRSNDKSTTTKADDVWVGNGAQFTPPTNTTGSQYYYAVATNRNTGYDDASANSNVATITITYDAAIPTFDDMDDYIYTFTEGTQAILRESADVNDNGTLTYKWYQMSGNTKNPVSDTLVSGGTNGELDITVASSPSTKKYYAEVTNTNNNATGDKVKTAIGPIHVVNSIKEVVVAAISITTPPTKTEYFVGDVFAPAGMEVTAYYSNGTTKALTAAKYTYTPKAALALTDMAITVSHTDPVGGDTFTAGLPITVAERPISGGGGSGAGASTYALTFAVNGGSKLDAVTKASGTEINLAAYQPTREGYDFAGWYGDEGLKTQVTSVKLTENTTVYAKWVEKSNLPFTDVKTDDWFYKDVAYVYDKNLMIGTSETIFAPHLPTTRSMIVTILYRMEGSPTVSGTSPFEDVVEGKWYTNAVKWAAANRIVSGYGNGKFGPDDNISREQMVAILYRYAQFKGYDISKTAELNAFKDADMISPWALSSVKWSVASELIKGMGDSTIAPKEGTTRSQMAALLQRFIENIAK